jgi:hypothetical protein
MQVDVRVELLPIPARYLVARLHTGSLIDLHTVNSRECNFGATVVIRAFVCSGL